MGPIDIYDPLFPHVMYLLSDELNRELYYIGDKYPMIEKFKKYELIPVRYSPSQEVNRELVWVIYDRENAIRYYDKKQEFVLVPTGNRLHADLTQFTDDISDWRNSKIENILNDSN